MLNDKITLKDLSIFTAEQGGGVFALLDHATTQAGRDMLRQHIHHPPDTYERLQQMQDAIKFWTQHPDLWPSVISNGTLIMLEKFFESADQATTPPGAMNFLMNPFFQKLLNKNEYFFTQFSLSHLSDFMKGCLQLAAIAKRDDVPALLKQELEMMGTETDHRLTSELIAINKNTSFREMASLAFKARRELKTATYRLMKHYARLDAWQSMARATVVNKWTFPELQPSLPVVFETKGLHHPLLERPIAYDIHFDEKQNFLLLTGANMSGKTTFMRALGVGSLLAHLGMGTPAQHFRLSFLHGIITNMHVEDNILKGESYFLAEVKRMKQTAQRLQEPKPHLVLMDELFKGTNVHDAYECTRAVIEGLLNRPQHLMILSTHLYEVAQHFNDSRGIQFAYFVTDTAPDNTYKFRYELRQGISNDRIGYRILQQEGVIDLLKKRES